MGLQFSLRTPIRPGSKDDATNSSPSIQSVSSRASSGVGNCQRDLPSAGRSPNSPQTSLSSETDSVLSDTYLQLRNRIKSKVIIQYPQRIESQVSPKSDLSIFSQRSLAHLPSLGNIFCVDSKEKAGTVKYRCVQTLNGVHSGYSSALSLGHDHLYTSFDFQYIRLWLKADLSEYCTFNGGGRAIRALVVTEDKLYIAHEDHKIRIWERSKQQPTVHKLRATMPTYKDYLATCIPAKNYVQTRRHHRKLWIEHVDTISVLAVAGNKFLYSGSWDRTVKVWDLSDFKCLESFKAHDDAINALLVSEDGFVYTGSGDAKIKVWAKVGGGKKHSLVTTMECHKSAVNALALSADGSLLYSSASDRTVVVWEREDSAQHMVAAGALRGHRHAVLCLATVGNIVCSGSADKTIRVWSKLYGTLHSCVAVLEGHRGPVKCLAVTMNDAMECLIYSGSLDHEIKLWKVERTNEADEAAASEHKQRSMLLR